MVQAKFAKFSWGFLICALAVSVWGAFVRASVSGDGCGNTWPSCGGSVIPTFEKAKTVIEYAHRMSVGLIVLLIGAQVIWCFLAFPKGSNVRKVSLWSTG